MVSIGNYAIRLRSRSLWQDPVRKIRTLESFAQTEIDGGENIAQAAKYVVDKKLKKHFLRHAAEEIRHGELFRQRAQELAERSPNLVAEEMEPDKMYDLVHARDNQNTDAHGFFSADRLEVVGEIPYVAMLHVAEKRAAAIFQIHSDLLRDDPETKAVFDAALRDEKYHVAYTGHYLRQCRERGRGREVRDALSAARGSRIVGSLKRLGVQSGAKFGVAVMYLTYFTVLVPFGLLGRCTKAKTGWTDATRFKGKESVTSQF